MTTTIKTFSKMLYAFVLFAGLIMTSCETADPVDDSKNPENSENTETPDNIIVFADEVVKKSCVEAFDTDGDGEVSYDEAAAVSDLSNVTLRFKDDFISFDEFQYFTNVKVIPMKFFSDCKLMKSIKLPESLRSIEKWGFLRCANLTEIVLPQNVENIGDYVFIGCTSLTKVYSKSLTPPYAPNYYDGMFPNSTNLEHIYVPIESVELYKKASGWEMSAEKIIGYYF